jgi:hypothetical protein
VSKGDGQALMLDQRFFHESVKGGFFIGTLIQGGSDKSGILKIFLENLTAQLKIFRFS